jgi:hypothetical protein
MEVQMKTLTMKAHELLATPDRWTQGAFAVDKYGYQTPKNGPDAYSFCVLGAINHCYGEFDEDAILRLENHTKKSLMEWNDAPERTHAEVLALLKELDI